MIITIKKLSVTVSSANWKIGHKNYYRQFGELSWKNQKLLKAVRPSEMQLIRLIESVRQTYCIAIDFTATSSEVEMINWFTNLKLTNISTFNYEFTIIKH